MLESPLHAMVSLRAAAKNMNELVVELSESLWRKGADREKHFPQRNWDREMHEEYPIIGPAVPEADIPNIHCTAVYLDNRGGYLTLTATCLRRRSWTRGLPR